MKTSNICVSFIQIFSLFKKQVYIKIFILEKYIISSQQNVDLGKQDKCPNFTKWKKEREGKKEGGRTYRLKDTVEL